MYLMLSVNRGNGSLGPVPTSRILILIECYVSLYITEVNH